jgi:endonuclease III
MPKKMLVRRTAKAEGATVASRPTNVDRVLAYLEALYPDPHCELVHRSPFELLIATQLSAQCTDKQVNATTPELFLRWPDARALAEAEIGEVEQVIRKTGFFKVKARNITSTARMLVASYGGQVPPRMEDLVKLPGTARKTANVVLGTAFGIQEGVVVDTHVFRVTGRWGWHREKEPERVEARLMRFVPREGWDAFGHRTVLFGRYHCTARKPECPVCGLLPVCPGGQGLMVESAAKKG